MNELKEPSYYALIPSTVRYDTRLRFAERLLYGEITALIGKEGYCFASNQYFANLYGVIPGTISTWISHLNKLGYIRVELIKDDNKQIIERRIFITDNSYRAFVQSTYTLKKVYPSNSNKRYPIIQKKKDNNINIRIDRLFDSIIKRKFSEEFKLEEDYYEFYKIIERLEFNYTEENMKIFSKENIEKLKIIVYCIKEIYISKKSSLLLRATREKLIDVYDNCKEFENEYLGTNKEIQNFFDYYYASVIRKLET